MKEKSKERKLGQRARTVEAGTAYFPQVHSGAGKAENSRPSGDARYRVQSKRKDTLKGQGGDVLAKLGGTRSDRPMCRRSTGDDFFIRLIRRQP